VLVLVQQQLQSSPRAAAQLQGLQTAHLLLALQAAVLSLLVQGSPRRLQAALLVPSKEPPGVLQAAQALPQLELPLR
jgi:hypothetical protein